MRPILMKGHERPLTFLKYNRDGDLLFSCAKDHTPTVWFADNGERLGTYRGHNGAVWTCDVSSMSSFWCYSSIFFSLGSYFGNQGLGFSIRRGIMVNWLINWLVDCSGDSMRLITGSADQTVKLWNVETGAQLFTFNFDSPARSVDFSVGDKLAVITTDPFMELTSAIHVKRIARDPSQRNFYLLFCYLFCFVFFF